MVFVDVEAHRDETSIRHPTVGECWSGLTTFVGLFGINFQNTSTVVMHKPFKETVHGIHNKHAWWIPIGQPPKF